MDELTLEELIARIKDADDKVRAAAWESAGPLGAQAIGPLAATMTDENIEIGRAAKNALWKIVRHVGRPGADDDRKAVEAALCDLLGNDRVDAVRREILWMLSEIGGEAAVAAIRDIPGIVENTSLREDARCTLERIPTESAVAVLQEGLEIAPDDYKTAIAQSLRARGVHVPGLPCQKRVPTRETNVEPIED